MFVDANHNYPLKKDMYQPWYLAEPNGDTLENCVSTKVSLNAWNDINCSDELCAFCEFERAPDLQIRGGNDVCCIGSYIQNKYFHTFLHRIMQ